MNFFGFDITGVVFILFGCITLMAGWYASTAVKFDNCAVKTIITTTTHTVVLLYSSDMIRSKKAWGVIVEILDDIAANESHVDLTCIFSDITNRLNYKLKSETDPINRLIFNHALTMINVWAGMITANVKKYKAELPGDAGNGFKMIVSNVFVTRALKSALKISNITTL